MGATVSYLPPLSQAARSHIAVTGLRDVAIGKSVIRELSPVGCWRCHGSGTIVEGMAGMTVGTIGYGTLGSMQTLQKMKGVINKSLTDPLVIETARRIVATQAARDYDAHARAIKNFLIEHFQFVRDPRGVEMLATPRYLLTEVGRRYIVQG